MNFASLSDLLMGKPASIKISAAKGGRSYVNVFLPYVFSGNYKILTARKMKNYPL